MISFSHVIVITGTPGVGKTTISKILTERLDAYYLSISELAKKESLIANYDVDKDSVIPDMDKLRDAISTIIETSLQDVIIDGHLASDVVLPSLATNIFVLRLDPSVLQKRLQARGYKTKKIKENVAAEILDVCLVDAIAKQGVERVDEIDITEMSVKEVVDKIMKVLQGRIKPRFGGIDWLENLEMTGRLDEFLPFLNFF
ncbi:MAG: adenylate kinase family protein [Candidatus Bathyarchaeota archaeon]|nr:MAG: adenylate kinase family protein [Candidatus Bathyarchaeota archaeon]